jgi:hypothetical protein
MSHSGTPDEVMDVDVLDVSDFRFEGGTAGSVAEEIAAQAAAGYSTAVLHLNGPLQARAVPFNPAIRRCIDTGLARLVLPHQRVRAKVVVARHPAVLQHADVELAGVETEQLVVVVNAAPHDIDGYEHYRVDAVCAAGVRHFGVEPRWAPIGPLVRRVIAPDLASRQLFDDDWVNIIDVDAWAVPRTGWVSDRPVIGRHSRDNPQKWPAELATLQQVYPTDGSVRVRVLGGVAPATALLGELPDSWEVWPFGALDPRDFLSRIDFFVYYHDPRWTEAFGRTTLEALASGAVAILPPHFAVLFGDAARYAEPDQVRPLIDELYADRAAYEEQSATGRSVARRRFGHEAHVARLSELIGPPTGGRRDSQPEAPVRTSPSETPLRSREPESRPGAGRPARVLMISSNGTGMGHLTRLLAYSQRAPAGLRPYFLSLSQAVPVVTRFGHPYEYVPSMQPTGLEPERWHEYFRARVSEAVERLRPAAVVFDGTWPYKGIPEVRSEHPDVPWIWSRRGMWYRGQNRDQLAKADWFDQVIEPGDLAAPADQGVTTAEPAVRIGPVTLLDPDDLDDSEAARRALGIDAQMPTALVTLGAGNINDPTSATRITVDAIRALGLRICVTRPEIAERGGAAAPDVDVVSVYPLSRHYRAFDVAVSAAGYNSFHELLRFGVPTLFLPNLDTALDDQRSRARYAADQGWAHSLDKAEPENVRKLVGDLLENGSAMVERVRAADPGNGASAAMEAITDLADRRRP